MNTATAGGVVHTAEGEHRGIRRAVAALWVSALALSPLGAAIAQVATPATRDSAGIRIVEFPPAGLAALPEWTLRGPTVTIGEAMGEPEYTFNRIGLVWRLQDGRIVVPNEITEIRFYDTEGKYLSTAGRRGRGPGEYSYLQSLWRRPGDTLFAFDAIATRGTPSRIDVRDPAGRLVRAHAVTWGAGIGTAWLPDGSALYLDYDRQDWSTVGMTERGLSVRRVSRAGEAGDTVLRVRVAGLYITTPGIGIGVRVSVGALLSGGPHGAVYAYGSTFAVHWFDARGRLVAITRVPLARERVTERDKRDADAAELAMLAARPPLGREAGGRRAQAVYAEFRPMVTRIRVDSEGNAWVRRWTTASSKTAEWIVLAPGGPPIARIRMPAEFLANDIGPDWALGIATDDEGVQYVRMYQVQR